MEQVIVRDAKYNGLKHICIGDAVVDTCRPEKAEERAKMAEEYLSYVRPDLVQDRGGRTCAKCGGNTRTVLDGEAWCDNCQRYQ